MGYKTIIIKHSNVLDHVPTDSDLIVGELALNTANGRLYCYDDNSPAGIKIIGEADFVNVTGDTITGDLTVLGTFNTDDIAVDNGIIVNNAVPLDTRYGPYSTTAAAKAAVVKPRRYKGLTVGILQVASTVYPYDLPLNRVMEYWWKDGTQDYELIRKQTELTDCGNF